MKERILFEMEKAYQPVIWTLPEDFCTEEHFHRVINRLDMKSSPGIPYCFEATTNGGWLKWNGVSADSIQLKRLWYDVCRVFDDDYEHIIRVFIKQEPHKAKKIEQERWRLILASSLPVQVAWHMLFDPMNDLEITKAYEIPSQQGLVLVGGGWKLFRDSWKARGLNYGLDKSAWDWTAPAWMLNMDLHFRYRMGRGLKMAEWLKRAELLYRHMFEDPILQMSNGEMYQQEIPGIMKSGCVNTISTNSHCQIFLHIATMLLNGEDIYPLPVACGDDTLQHPKHCQDVDPYNAFGVVVKSVSDTAEFMGHTFSEKGPQPLYMQKHLYKMFYVADEDVPDYLDSMARMYVHTPYFQFWERLALNNGTPLRMSRQAFEFWYDVGV